MRSLNDTIAEIRKTTRAARIMMEGALASYHPRAPDGLAALENFGSDPGNLSAWIYAPPGLRPGAPLIVALHGCSQGADDFAKGSGWPALADEIGAAVLFPEQKPSNNPRMCFNWFALRHVSKFGGEAESISEMIDCAVERYRISPRRIFVVGLSAGGAMAAALLALFPDRFEAGAAIAGLPYGSAANALEALDAMQNGAEKFADLRVLEPERTHWPRLAIWQGLDDRVVHPANGRRLAEQWAGAFGPGVVPVSVEPAGERATARRWKDRAGRTLVELIQIKDFGHGAPVDSRLGRVASDYMIDSEVDSSRAIAAFWGLLPGEADASEARDDASLSRRWREQVERARRLLDREGGSGPSQGSNPVDPG